MDINEVKLAFRQNMSRLIRLSGKNLKEYAAETGTTSATLSRYLHREDKIPDLGTVIRICDYANVSLDWIFGRTGDQYNNMTESYQDIVDLYRIASEEDKRVIDAILNRYRKDS